MRWIIKYLRIFFILWMTFVFLFANFEFLHLHKLTISIPAHNCLGIEQSSINNQSIYWGFQNCLIETFVKSLQIGFTFFGGKSFFFHNSYLNNCICLFKFPLLQNQVQLPTPRAPPILFV
jgi:hypothetical protein